MEWYWLYQLINVGLNDVRAALGALNRAVAGVWSYVGGLWANMMTEVNRREAAHFRYTTSVLQTTLAIRDALLHIIRDQIPAWINDATANVVAWTHLRLNSLRTELLNLITVVQRWAAARLDATDVRLSSVTAWLDGRLSRTETTLGRVAGIVNALLTDPKRLAAWGIDAFMMTAGRWTMANLDRLAVLLFGNLITLALKSILIIERLIARFV